MHRYCISPAPKIDPSPWEIGSPMSHMVPTAYATSHPKRHLDRFCRFCMAAKCYTVQCIVIGEENPKIAHSPWDFITLPEEDRATAIDSMRRKLVKIARAVPQLSSRTYRQTHRQTDRHTYKRIHRNTSPPLTRSHGRSKNHNLKGLAVGKLS